MWATSGALDNHRKRLSFSFQAQVTNVKSPLWAGRACGWSLRVVFLGLCRCTVVSRIQHACQWPSFCSFVACKREVLGRCWITVSTRVWVCVFPRWTGSTQSWRTPALHDDLNAGREPESVYRPVTSLKLANKCTEYEAKRRGGALFDTSRCSEE